MKTLIKGGRVIDPARNIDEIGSVYIDGKTIGAPFDEAAADNVVDAKGLWVVPGLIDVHVHLREPGGEYKETIETGLKAAAAGGFTAVLPMPNTTPPIDSPALVNFLMQRSAELGGTRIYPVPAITKGRQGKVLTDMAALKHSGAVAFSDDGSGIDDDQLMLAALIETERLNVPLAQHSEFAHVSAGGAVHRGSVSEQLGIKSIPIDSEDQMAERDIALAKQTKAHLHISHVSSKNVIEMVRQAKKEGVHVTAEVAPHHLHLTDELLLKGSTVAKVSPPLRPMVHVEACRQGLADGTLDVVATDHAPHSQEDKAGGFEKAAFGMVGLEISVPTLLLLVEQGLLSPVRMIEAMSTLPAKIFNLPGGTLKPGSLADVALINPNLPHQIDPSTFYSKGRNTPFAGFKVPGRAVQTFVDGKVVFALKK